MLRAQRVDQPVELGADSNDRVGVLGFQSSAERGDRMTEVFAGQLGQLGIERIGSREGGSVRQGVARMELERRHRTSSETCPAF